MKKKLLTFRERKGLFFNYVNVRGKKKLVSGRNASWSSREFAAP